MNEELKKRAVLLRSALMALPGYGEETHLESWETWIEPSSQISHEFVVLERPEYRPIAYFHTESRTLSVDIARAFATILDVLPGFLTALGESGDDIKGVPEE